MNSHTTKSFREALHKLPAEIREQAREAYEQFKIDPFSPGLNFEEVNPQNHIWSARITRRIVRSVSAFEMKLRGIGSARIVSTISGRSRERREVENCSALTFAAS